MGSFGGGGLLCADQGGQGGGDRLVLAEVGEEGGLGGWWSGGDLGEDGCAEFGDSGAGEG